MNLTEESLQEVKTFLEANMKQQIDVRLIHCMTHNEVISAYFYGVLYDFIDYKTNETVKDFIYSLNEPVKYKRFKFLPFLFVRSNN